MYRKATLYVIYNKKALIASFNPGVTYVAVRRSKLYSVWPNYLKQQAKDLPDT